MATGSIADIEIEEEPKFSHGQAQFTFRDLLRPNVKELKLRAEVFPKKKAAVTSINNLDLNTTAKKADQGQEL